VVVAGGSVSDVALHFLEKYNIMVIKIMSKFELRRIASAVGATMLVRYVRSGINTHRARLFQRKLANAQKLLCKKFPAKRSLSSDPTRKNAALAPSL